MKDQTVPYSSLKELFLQNSMVSQAEVISKSYQLLVSDLISFLETVWVPLM